MNTCEWDETILDMTKNDNEQREREDFSRVRCENRSIVIRNKLTEKTNKR